MANSPVVTSLPAYIEEHRLPLISKTIAGAKTAGLVQLETDVKAKTALNLLTTEVVFGDGETCGWNEAGQTTLSQRYIDPAFLKVNMAFCDKKLLRKWANYEVQLAAGREVLPFEEAFTADIVKHVNAAVEKLIWQGDSTEDNQFDGYIKILNADGAVKVTFTDGDSAYNRIKAVYEALPGEIALKEDTVIFVSEADYRDYIQDLVAANLYHFVPENGNGEYVLPGTAVKVIAVAGLNGSKGEHKYDTIVAGQLSNMFYGCAAEEDKQTFDVWYSKDNREFRLAIEFAAGVQVAFPDQMVIGTIQA